MTHLARTTGVALVCCVVSLPAAQILRADSLIEWTADRTLTRRDFKGRIPSRSSDASRSWVLIDASWECKDGVGSSQARAVFDPDRSWWKDSTPNLWRGIDDAAAPRTRSDGERALLAHEQLHFDLTEVWARKVRAALADLPTACKTREGINRMETTIAALEREWQAEQVRYDRETDHGADARRQAAWEAKTRQSLAEDYPSAAR
jgi:Bacterial protein of unknown function (DUF922)